MASANSCGDQYPQYWQDAQGNTYSLHPWQLQAPVGNSFDWENTGCPPRQGSYSSGPTNNTQPFYSWSTTSGTGPVAVDLTQVKLQIAVTDNRRKKNPTTVVQVSVQDILDQLTGDMKKKIIQKVALNKALEEL